jgi:hypothetical protein
MKPTVSVIINTLNRGDMLSKVLTSLQWLKYEGEFEVIVVNGPSTDNTASVLEEWNSRIRVGQCEVANLSVSRNIGINMAWGEFVLFIDDDAYPEPEWLDQMIAPFDNPCVGAVGGIVYDNTGFVYQYEYRTVTRLLNCNLWAKTNAENLCYPCSFEFPYPPGGNAAYRRNALIEVGGFDEEIEYWGDEVDVAVRLIDAGFLIRNISGGYVHHKSAPSNIRSGQKVINNWYSFLKNKIYLSLKNGRSHKSLEEIQQDNIKFSLMWERDIKEQIAAGLLTDDDLNRFKEQKIRAWEVGVSRGLSNETRLLSNSAICPTGDFKKFRTLGDGRHVAIVLVSQSFPPSQTVGIPALIKERSEALANLGLIAHVVTQSPDINRVDFENGVWVHRVLNSEHELPPAAANLNIPQSIWNWSATARQEVERISQHREISIVEAPILDCQGIAFLVDHKWPLVTSLTTTHSWLESHPESRADENWMKTFGEPMLALENEIMNSSDGIHSISAAIERDAESAYASNLEDAWNDVELGIQWWSTAASKHSAS